MFQYRTKGFLDAVLFAIAAVALLHHSTGLAGGPGGIPEVVTGGKFKVVDEFTLEDGRKVETVELPDCRCFQPNRQFGQIDDHDLKFVNGEWGNHEFVFVQPARYAGGPISVFLHLKGGGFAWVNNSIPSAQIPPELKGVAWGQTQGDGLHSSLTLLSTQWWNRKHTYSALTFGPFEEAPSHRGNPNTFISQLRKRFPNWGIIYPSYCSRDAYFGKGEVGLDGRRFGYVALIQALKYVNDKYGIKEMFVGGTSAGALGASVIARDLKNDIPHLKLLGAIIDSGPAEGQAYAAVKDEGTVNGLRQIVVDEKGTKAWIQCKEPLQDTRRGLTAINFLGFSFSKAIEKGQVTIPLFHAWQSRDNVISCGDLSHSQQFLDGAIARAITRHNPGGLSVNYEKCEGTTPACAQKDPLSIEKCAPENIVQVPCSRHGVVGGGPNVEDALRWMETVIEKSTGVQAGRNQQP